MPPEILGKSIDGDQQRAQWLSTVHEFRRIGVLVEGPASNAPLPERRRKEDENFGELAARVCGDVDWEDGDYETEKYWPGCLPNDWYYDFEDDEGEGGGEDVDTMDIDS